VGAGGNRPLTVPRREACLVPADDQEPAQDARTRRSAVGGSRGPDPGVLLPRHAAGFEAARDVVILRHDPLYPCL
jgi:hypothetical protein